MSSHIEEIIEKKIQYENELRLLEMSIYKLETNYFEQTINSG